MSQHPFSATVVRRIDELVATACPTATAPGLLVGLSGGPDSVALLLTACDWARSRGRFLAAAHLHHGLRADAADEDAVFCAALCRDLEVPLHQRSADPRTTARARGLGLEEAGRHLRRRFFLALLEQEPGLGCVATGHHRDDQIETVLMRLFRGTGPEGLRGIRPVHGRFIHPLLDCDRAAIVAYLAAEGRPWRTDATNLTGDNLRARVRRELLPLVRGIFGPGGAPGVARLAELLHEELELLARWTRQARQRITLDDGLSVAGLLALEPALARRVLRSWLDDDQATEQPERLERVHVENILAWLRHGQSGTGLDLPGRRRLRRDFDTVRLEPAHAPRPVRSAADYRVTVKALSPGTPPPTDPGVGDVRDETTWQLTCPAATLRGNLRVRGWQSGDRLVCLGMTGSKKLSDLLREQRVSVAAREDVLVVDDDEGILWVVGLARAERTRLLPDTTRMVTISLIRRTTPT